MLTGTIVENSLKDTTVLDKLTVLKSWIDGDWKLHKVELARKTALGLADCLEDGPWYFHFWDGNEEDILVVFKNKYFDIKSSDKSTWSETVTYGKSCGIPEEQLDFLIN